MELSETVHTRLDSGVVKALREQGKRLGLNLSAYARLLLTTSVGSVVERRDAPPPGPKKGRKAS